MAAWRFCIGSGPVFTRTFPGDATVADVLVELSKEWPEVHPSRDPVVQYGTVRKYTETLSTIRRIDTRVFVIQPARNPPQEPVRWMFAVGRGAPFARDFLPSVTIRQALAAIADSNPECGPDRNPAVWFAGKRRDYGATLGSLDGSGRISIRPDTARPSRAPRPLLEHFPQVIGEQMPDGSVVLEPPDAPRLPVDLTWPAPSRAVREQAARELRRERGAFDRIVSFAQARDPATARQIAGARAAIYRALGVTDRH
jgi:hypothetical protein